MLARLVSGWTGKILVLVLLGFAATDFVLTKTLSTAEAASHLVTNPHWPLAVPNDAEKTRQAILVTSFLLILLGASFLRGFREVIVLAVGIVFVYMTLSALVTGAGVIHLFEHQELFEQFHARLESGDWYLRDRPRGDRSTDRPRDQPDSFPETGPWHLGFRDRCRRDAACER
jgi:hypothetical protein